MDDFEKNSGIKIEKSVPETMLHQGISKNYLKKKDDTWAQPEVRIHCCLKFLPKKSMVASIAETKAENFIKIRFYIQSIRPVFFNYKMHRYQSNGRGCTAYWRIALPPPYGYYDDIIMSYPELIEDIKNLCGRFILKWCTTGVEVCLSMQHGGPFRLLPIRFRQ